MVQLIPIENSEEIDPEFKQIYTEAFPPEERRDWQQLIDLLPNSKFKIYKISFQNRFIGIISIWKLAGFNFIEHFAIRDSERKKGYGTLILKQIINHETDIMILEVEESVSVEARRRIEFYERLNFSANKGFIFNLPIQPGKEKLKCY